jgi:hypothetical protein
MRNKFTDAQNARINKKEGDLYKVITVGGRSFEIYYGYYEEMDRQNPSVEPMEIYPDFLESPVYTDEGIPFAVAMQTPCEHFLGAADEDNTCYQCGYYEGQEELLGLCRCKWRAKK